jgi:hypothetical protein
MLTIADLRSRNDYILFYTKKSMCIECLTSRLMKDKYIVVVLHGMEILEKVLECAQVHTIMIVDNNSSKQKLPKYENDPHRKIVTVSEESDSILAKLQQVITGVENQITLETGSLFSTFDRRQRSLRDLQRESAPFLWSQIFKGILKIYDKFNTVVFSDAESYASFSGG